MNAFVRPIEILIKFITQTISAIWMIFLFVFLFFLTKKNTIKLKILWRWISIFPPRQTPIVTFFLLLSDKNRTLFTLSFCLDTKERKNQVADYSSIHSTLETRPKQRSLRAASRCPYFNSLHFIRIIGDRKKKSNIFFF